MTTRILAIVSAVAIVVSMSAGTALAGEWNPQGDVAAKQKGKSLCRFSGLDQPDDGPNPEDHHGGDPDDGFWSTTPAGANSSGPFAVQNGGQMIAIGALPPGFQGLACNPQSGFEE
jgi:hypothetical protein